MVGCTCGISHPVVDDVPERRPIADNLDLTGIGSTTNQPVRACRSIITAVSNVCCNFYRHGYSLVGWKYKVCEYEVSHEKQDRFEGLRYEEVLVGTSDSKTF